jgi:deoxyribodipyrimidine photolyase
MSANVNWQWAAGTGCDAVCILEYLILIQQRNLTKGVYIRKWIKEFDLVKTYGRARNG